MNYMHRVLLVIDDYNEMMYLETLLKKLGFDVDGIQNHTKVSEKLLVFNPQAIICSALGKRVDGRQVIKELARKPRQPHLVLLKQPTQVLSDEFEDPSYVDAILDSPVSATSLLEWMARFFGMDEALLIEKYNKMKSQIQVPQGNHQSTSSQSPEIEEEFENELKGMVPQGDKAKIYHGQKNASGSAQHIQGTSSSQPAAAANSKISNEESDVPPRAQVQMPTTTLSAEEREKRFANVLQNLEPSPSDGFDTKRVRQFRKDIRQAENIDELHDLEEERRNFVKALFKK